MDRYRDDRRSRSGVNAGTSSSSGGGYDDEIARLQLENQSGYILLENGDRILLEQ